MANYDYLYSAYLKADDVDEPFEVVVEEVVPVEFAEGKSTKTKLVLHCEGLAQGIVCNTARYNAMKAMYGGDVDNWVGRAIRVGRSIANFKGRPVGSITIEKPRG